MNILATETCGKCKLFFAKPSWLFCAEFDLFFWCFDFNIVLLRLYTVYIWVAGVAEDSNNWGKSPAANSSGISSFKDLTYFSVANTFPRCNCSSTLGPDVQTANILIEWMFPFFSMWREMLNELGYTFTFSTVFYCEILFKMSWKFCSPKIKTVIFISFKTFLSIVLQRLINKIKRWAATERQPIPRWSTAAIKWQAVTFQNGLGEDRMNNNISEWKFGRNVRIQNGNLVSTCHTWSSC